MTSPIDKLLPLLDKVKPTGPGKWQALCPAHLDKRPSLSIREVDDGKILLKCWTGCGAADVVAALGLSLADLFPGDRYSVTGTGPLRRPFDWRGALEGVSHEAMIIRLAVEQLANGARLDHDDIARLALAEERIADALRAAGGAR